MDKKLSLKENKKNNKTNIILEDDIKKTIPVEIQNKIKELETYIRKEITNQMIENEIQQEKTWYEDNDKVDFESLENLKKLLKECHSGFHDVVKMNTYIVNFNPEIDLLIFRKIRKEF